MKLLRLVLRGFKSFADKTTVEFAEGMTVIVGPNGCGKSNISDAVRWVLGEQNVRNIRGQKAEDVIFAGSETRGAKQAAEVTLALDNSMRELPIESAEVEITRRVLRNGDSEFQINRRHCRLKDIQELLVDTGLGKGSLAMIGQNRVDRVLTAHPEERRLIFEDVAGIGLYRMRKTEGMRKLEQTSDNMERVRDMTALLEEELSSLREGAEKAQIYKKLSREKEAVEVTASLLRLASARRMLSRYENEHRDLSDRAVTEETKLAELSLKRAKWEQEEARDRGLRREAGEEAARRQRETEELRGDFRVKEEALRHEEERQVHLCREGEEQKEGEAKRREETEAAQAERERAEAERRRQAKLLREAEERSRQIRASWETAESERHSAEEAKREQVAKRERLVRDQSHFEKEFLRLTEEVAEEEKLFAEAEAVSESARKEAEEAGRWEEKAKEARERLFGEEERLRSERVQAEKERLAASTEADQRQSAWDSAKQRRAWLESAEKEYRDFSQAAKAILRRREQWEGHVEGALGDLLRVPSLYTQAAEAALGASVSYIVTDTAQAAAYMMEWLREHEAGRTTFYPLDAMKPRFSDAMERKACSESGICGVASDLFGHDRRYADLIRHLLGRTLIAEDLTSARKVARKYGQALRLVTLDGQIIHAGGSMTGGSSRQREHSFFGRKQEIEELLQKEERLRRDTEIAREKREKKERRYADVTDRLTKVGEERQRWDIAWAEGKARKMSAERSVRDGDEVLQKRENRLRQARTKLREAQLLVDDVSKRLADCPDATVRAESEERERLRDELSCCEAAVLRFRIDFTKAEEALRFCERIAAERMTAQEEQERRRGEWERKKRDNEASLSRLRKEAQSVKVRFLEAEKAWEVAQSRLEWQREASERLSAERRIDDEAWKTAQMRLAGIQRDLAEREARIEHFREEESKERIFLSERSLTEAAAERLRMPGTMTEMKERQEAIVSQIMALGAVNPQGEEEYERQKRRRDFYQSQLEDLQKAKSGLETVITDMDATMTATFKAAFEKINEEFGRVMKIMFSGGKARLALTDEARPLDGGVEIYLQMPGKKSQPLTLMSGGERALTVIALLLSFMAYRPAPFCFVDEVDAALDEANVERYGRMMADYKKKTQFIVISHRKKTMEFADTLQGVTMGEKGVSSLITVRMGDYIREA